MKGKVKTQNFLTTEIAEGGAPQRKPFFVKGKVKTQNFLTTEDAELRREKLFFERTGDPRFVILIRLLAEKNLVLVFDLSSIHDSRLAIHEDNPDSRRLADKGCRLAPEKNPTIFPSHEFRATSHSKNCLFV